MNSLVLLTNELVENIDRKKQDHLCQSKEDLASFSCSYGELCHVRIKIKFRKSSKLLTCLIS